jgi:hypothetical protein
MLCCLVKLLSFRMNILLPSSQRVSQVNGTAKFKQKPVTVGGRTMYRTLSPKRTPFKTGLTDSTVCIRCLEEDETATHFLCKCQAIAYFRFHRPDHYFMEPADYHDTPVSRILHFIRSVGLFKG